MYHAPWWSTAPAPPSPGSALLVFSDGSVWPTHGSSGAPFMTFHGNVAPSHPLLFSSPTHQHSYLAAPTAPLGNATFTPHGLIFTTATPPSAPHPYAIANQMVTPFNLFTPHHPSYTTLLSSPAAAMAAASPVTPATTISTTGPNHTPAPAATPTFTPVTPVAATPTADAPPMSSTPPSSNDSNAQLIDMLSRMEILVQSYEKQSRVAKLFDTAQPSPIAFPVPITDHTPHSPLPSSFATPTDNSLSSLFAPSTTPPVAPPHVANTDASPKSPPAQPHTPAQQHTPASTSHATSTSPPLQPKAQVAAPTPAPPATRAVSFSSEASTRSATSSADASNNRSRQTATRAHSASTTKLSNATTPTLALLAQGGFTHLSRHLAASPLCKVLATHDTRINALLDGPLAVKHLYDVPATDAATEMLSALQRSILVLSGWNAPTQGGRRRADNAVRTFAASIEKCWRILILHRLPPPARPRVGHGDMPLDSKTHTMPMSRLSLRLEALVSHDETAIMRLITDAEATSDAWRIVDEATAGWQTAGTAQKVKRAVNAVRGGGVSAAAKSLSSDTSKALPPSNHATALLVKNKFVAEGYSDKNGDSDDVSPPAPRGDAPRASAVTTSAATTATTTTITATPALSTVAAASAQNDSITIDGDASLFSNFSTFEADDDLFSHTTPSPRIDTVFAPPIEPLVNSTSTLCHVHAALINARSASNVRAFASQVCDDVSANATARNVARAVSDESLTNEHVNVVAAAIVSRSRSVADVADAPLGVPTGDADESLVQLLEILCDASASAAPWLIEHDFFYKCTTCGHISGASKHTTHTATVHDGGDVGAALRATTAPGGLESAVSRRCLNTEHCSEAQRSAALIAEDAINCELESSNSPHTSHEHLRLNRTVFVTLSHPPLTIGSNPTPTITSASTSLDAGAAFTRTAVTTATTGGTHFVTERRRHLSLLPGSASRLSQTLDATGNKVAATQHGHIRNVDQRDVRGVAYERAPAVPWHFSSPTPQHDTTDMSSAHDEERRRRELAEMAWPGDGGFGTLTNLNARLSAKLVSDSVALACHASRLHLNRNLVALSTFDTARIALSSTTANQAREIIRMRAIEQAVEPLHAISLMPCFSEGHFALLVLSPVDETTFAFDSMSQTAFFSPIWAEATEKIELAFESFVTRVIDDGQQRDAVSCGPITIARAMTLALSHSALLGGREARPLLDSETASMRTSIECFILAHVDSIDSLRAATRPSVAISTVNLSDNDDSDRDDDNDANLHTNSASNSITTDEGAAPPTTQGTHEATAAVTQGPPTHGATAPSRDASGRFTRTTRTTTTA
jgi:hypothetical protein